MASLGRFFVWSVWVIVFTIAGYLSLPPIFNKLIILKEPSFQFPLSLRLQVLIRQDSRGDGRFGARRSNGTRKHQGIDIQGKIGEPVFAAKSGVAETGEVARGMGKYVKITHPDGCVTIYGHMSVVTIPNRRWVWQGSKIGEMGKTGNSNYPDIEAHLHFEIRKEDKSIDPEPLIIRQPSRQ